jgi:preprotein translocase subunit SecE
MNVKQQVTASKFDVIKFVLIALLFISGFVANYHYAQVPWPIIAVGWLILVCIAAVIALQTVLGRRFWKFVREARAELRKVVWPSRKQIFQVTLMVIGVVIAFAIVMWILDAGLMVAMKWFTGQGG